MGVRRTWAPTDLKGEMYGHPVRVAPAQERNHRGNKTLLKGPMALGPRRLTCEGVSLPGSVRSRWGGKEASKRQVVASTSTPDLLGEQLACPLRP